MGLRLLPFPVGIGPLVPAPHLRSTSVVFCNRSDFSSAVVVHRNFVPHVRWTCITRFATYVLLGVILIVCAYLPQSGHGDDLYDEAIDEIRATRSRAPKHRHVCLACDANSSLDGLANVEGYGEVIGPVIHQLTEKGPRTHRGPGSHRRVP